MKKVDFIIVGQGIAGTFLSWFLLRNNKTFVCIDSQKKSSASAVAAGIIHPITGRRIVKTWLVDTLLPFAKQTYGEIESHFEKKIFHSFPILELVSNSREYNDWMSRSADTEMQAYIENFNDDSYQDILQYFPKKILINHTAWIDIEIFLSTFREDLKRKNLLTEEIFDRNKLILTDHGVEYSGIYADKIIFCEGAEAIENPFWKSLPFLPAKGEIILVRAEMKLNHILNRKIFILPVGENLFKVGSTYSWKFDDDKPTAEAKEFLTQQLKLILKIPFEVVDHKAAVRPTVKNRRPFLGLHPSHHQIGILNGLGTKGCLLAPYFASQMAGFLCGKNELMPETDVAKI